MEDIISIIKTIRKPLQKTDKNHFNIWHLQQMSLFIFYYELLALPAGRRISPNIRFVRKIKSFYQ